MIRLLAVAPKINSALFLEHGKTFFIRPPYFTEPQEVEEDYNLIMRAVKNFGYRAEYREFHNLDELKEYISSTATQDGQG